MKTLYIVCWSGGYEAPSYSAFADLEEAWDEAEVMWQDADHDKDQIDVISIDLATLAMARVEKRN